MNESIFLIGLLRTLIFSHTYNNVRTLWNPLPQELGAADYMTSERERKLVMVRVGVGEFICAPFCRRGLHKIYSDLYI